MAFHAVEDILQFFHSYGSWDWASHVIQAGLDNHLACHRGPPNSLRHL